MRCAFDHLVFAASDLATGVDWFAQQTGIALPAGGRHPLMGTHNHLLALSCSSFLEVIAVDPQAPTPARTRWFSLDDAVCQARLTESPRLLTWVVGVDDLSATLSRLADAGVDAGRAVELSRDALRWRISVRDDGALIDGGTFPVLIEWPEGAHPAEAMTDAGARLDELVLTHPEPAVLQARLALIGADEHCRIVAGPEGAAPALAATLSVDGQAIPAVG